MYPNSQHRDRTTLPYVILSAILNKFMFVYDYIRFNLVCNSLSGRLFTLNNSHKITSKLPQHPLLIVPSIDGIEGKQSLYNFTTNEILDYDFKVNYKKRCCGSSHGWLIMVEETFDITLSNPFSGKLVRFPPLTRDIIGRREDEEPYNYSWHVAKAILTKDPLRYPNDYMVVAIYGHSRKIAIIKVNDKTWTYLNLNSQRIPPHCFEDVNVDHNGVVYALDASLGLWKVKALNDGDSGNSTFCLDRVTRRLMPSPLDPVHTTVYIVESSRGELLLVRRFLRVLGPPMDVETVSFKVYKLTDVCKDGSRRFVRAENLDHDAMFIGDNHSMCVSTKDFSKCLPDNIYFTDNFLIFGIPLENGPRDVGIFNVQDGNFGTHYVTNPAHKYLPPPIWITQTFFDDFMD